MKKKLAALVFALLFSFGMISCAKDAPETKTDDASAKEQQTTEAEEVPDWDLTDKIASWIGYAETGTLTKPGEYKVYDIAKAEDLDPFRSYLNLTAEEEKNLLANEKDAVLLVEFCSSTEHSTYDLVSILAELNAVTIEIDEEELDEITPAHSFMLYHFPYETIAGTSINFNVIYG